MSEYINNREYRMGGIMENNKILCPTCNSNKLVVKYEAKYVYSYSIDNDVPGLNNKKEFLPFLYDGREQTEAKQYVECCVCGTIYPCFFSQGSQGLDFKVLHQALEKGEVKKSGLENKST